METELLELLQALRAPDQRAAAVSGLQDLYREWMAQGGVLPTTPAGGQDPSASPATAGAEEPAAAAAPTTEFHRQLPTLLRLSVECPYAEVRDGMATLLEELREWGGAAVPLSASSRVSTYIEPELVVPLTTAEEEIRMEFENAFDLDGRVSHMTRLMAYHPQYLTAFRESYQQLLWGDGPLQLPERHLLAVLAAARHKCQYLMQIHSHTFLQLGGNPVWLEGTDALPAKLRHLLPINSILAHQPWLLTSGHIAAVVKSGPDYWSLSELIHAITIFATFHSLTGFIFGCGVTPEVDYATAAPEDLGTSAAELDEELDESAADPQSQRSARDIIAKLKAPLEPAEEVSQESNMRDFEIAEAVEDTPEEAAVMSDAAAFFCAGGVVQEPGCEVTTVDTHKDFDIKNKSLTLFRIQNFSWGDQGYTTMRRYLRELPELLDKQFSTIADLTYDSFGDEEGVDTLKFRRAITMYTMRTKGIVDDSYLYYEVNQLVKRPVKSYCKTITCFPQLTTKTHYATFIKQDEMKHSEKIHIILLAMEARKQSELIYAMKAVMDHTT